MKVQVLLLASAGLGQASWWIFGGGAKTEDPTEQVSITAGTEIQDGPTLGTGNEVTEPSLGVPEILITEPQSDAETVQSVDLRSETVVEPSTANPTTSPSISEPQGSYWSFWPFGSKPVAPELTVSEFVELDGEKPTESKETVLDVSVHFDDGELYEDATAFTEPATLKEVSSEETREEVPNGDNSDEKPEDVYHMDSQEPEPTYLHRRVKQPAIKSIVLPKTASLETIARHFDALITDNHIARYYFTRMTPLLKKRVKSLAAIYNFSVIDESSRTITVKRNKMGQFPSYDEVADLLEADERERKSRLSSRAYFNERQASLADHFDQVESAPLNKKGPVKVSPATSNAGGKKSWKRRGGAKLRNRQRKVKLAEQKLPSDEPIFTEQPQFTSSDSYATQSEYEAIADNADDYDIDPNFDEDGSFFGGDKPVENVWRFDLTDDHDYHRYYDGSEGERDQSWDEDRTDDFDYNDYNAYYDDADYHEESFAQKWKSNALFNSFF